MYFISSDALFLFFLLFLKLECIIEYTTMYSDIGYYEFLRCTAYNRCTCTCSHSPHLCGDFKGRGKFLRWDFPFIPPGFMFRPDLK